MEAIGRVAQDAEALGYRAVFMRDHIERDLQQHLMHTSTGFCEEGLDPGDPNMFECMTTMGYLAHATRSVEIGVMVLLLAQRNPIVTAKQIATLDAMSGGRILVGIGVGNADHRREMELLGVPYGKRGRITDDYIKAMEAIWCNPKSTYHGEYVDFEDLTVYPKPVRKPYPPLLIGGGYHLQPSVLRRVARFGDGWVPIAEPEQFRRGIPMIEDLARENGRRPDFTYMSYNFTSIAGTREEADRRYATASRSQRLMHERGDSTRIEAHDFRSRALVGGPDDIVKRVGEYVDSGVTYFELLFMTSTLDEMLTRMKLFSREVIPSF